MFGQKDVFAYFMIVGFAASPISASQEEFIMIHCEKVESGSNKLDSIIKAVFPLTGSGYTTTQKIYKNELQEPYTKKAVEEAINNKFKDQFSKDFEAKIVWEDTDKDVIIGDGENQKFFVDENYYKTTKPIDQLRASFHINIVDKRKIWLAFDSKKNEKILSSFGNGIVTESDDKKTSYIEITQTEFEEASHYFRYMEKDNKAIYKRILCIRGRKQNLEVEFENKDDNEKEPIFSQNRTKENTYEMTFTNTSNGWGWTILYIICGVVFSYAIYIFFSGDMPFLKKGKQEKRIKRKKK